MITHIIKTRFMRHGVMNDGASVAAKSLRDAIITMGRLAQNPDCVGAQIFEMANPDAPVAGWHERTEVTA